MSDAEDAAAGRVTRVTVGAVRDDGSGEPTRQVAVDGMPVGNAYSAADVTEFMRRADLDAALIEDPRIVEWRDGGPDVWE